MDEQQQVADLVIAAMVLNCLAGALLMFCYFL